MGMGVCGQNDHELTCSFLEEGILLIQLSHTLYKITLISDAKKERSVSIHLRQSYTEKTLLPLQLLCLASLPFVTDCPFSKNTSYNLPVFFY